MPEPRPEITGFLSGTRWVGADLVPLAGDASARRYWRLEGAVLMDHPVGTGAELRAFLSVAEHLRGLGLSAPEVFATDLTLGLILMEDLGDDVFARVIEATPSLEPELYDAAVSALALIREGGVPEGLVHFASGLMAEQAALVLDWYVPGIVPEGVAELFQAELETVLTESALGGDVMVLRDYHAENLIWLPDRDGPARAGLLDFQDALAGPMVYDLVSLLQDARRDVSEALAETMIARFAETAGLPVDDVHRAMAAVGAQRHLRILGIFARLAVRDGKPSYVDLIPRVWGHLQTCLGHPDLADLRDIVTGTLPAPTGAHLHYLRSPCPTARTR